MPFRLDPEQFPGRAKVQFTTSAEMPRLIYKACLATGTISNTVYCQHALAEALSRDLGIPLQDILDKLPPARGVSAHVFDPDEKKMVRHPITEDHTGGSLRPGPANTYEDVR